MDRGNTIRLGNRDVELILTTRATKEIASRYGGLENLGEKLMQSENMELALDEMVWLITLLANQGIKTKNLLDGANEPELTTDEVELLTSPAELATYKDAIVIAMTKGTRRDIKSEESPTKNTKAE